MENPSQVQKWTYNRYINVVSKHYKYISWAYSKMAIVFKDTILHV